LSSSATVIAAFGRDSLLLTGSGKVLRAKARSRALQPVAGDRVHLLPGGIIEAIAPRANELTRATGRRVKVLAANLTQVCVLVACEPSFSDELVCRLLIAAQRAGLPAILALNKIDLHDQCAAARGVLEAFAGIGIPLVEFAGKYGPGPLQAHLSGQRTVLVGQSGMGKSTLVRTLVPQAEVRIGEISRFLDAGRQTTTAARLYRLEGEAEIVDTPGVSEFGLGGLPASQIAAGFTEFAGYAGRCRFHDCRHLAEPDCAVRQAAGAGAIHARRLQLYERIVRQEAGYRAFT
jgi:ribosome biogenesis GTPase / thiamine phosphate phosphatase